MKKKICLSTVFACIVVAAIAQTDPVSKSPQWRFNADANFYFIPNDFFVLPVFSAVKNKLHLEARYNYEDRKTFSAWIGYNFEGGKKLEYAITPMIGGVVGLSNGIAPGVKTTLNFKNFEFYSESEYFFDFKSSENFFFYTWTDLTYAPTEWLWFGISGQRTRLYKTDLDVQRGLLIGAGLKKWELTMYGYNLFGSDDPFLIVTLSREF